MQPASAVEFREVMRGAFASGATEPVAGARGGRRAGTVLTLAATAAIADVAEFARDPGHTGRLTGSVTFPPIGAERARCEGTFQLFVPAPDPGRKLMVYRAAFRAAGVQYFLDGAKHVGRHSVLRAWGDTTTLYCRLHEGTDPSGPVVAAGVLRLGAFAFSRQLVSFRTPGARGLAGSLRALSGFLAFFSSELIDTYVLRRR
jgi:choline dehydrogenase-like flavoprotein